MDTMETDSESGECGGAGKGLVISCDDCAMQHTQACEDCVVSFILNREPGDAVVFDAEEARALRMLTRVGLVPRPRHVRRVG
jgi:Zn-finger protein